MGFAASEHGVVLGQKLWIGGVETQDIADRVQYLRYGVGIAQEVHEFRDENLQNLFFYVSPEPLSSFPRKRDGIGFHVRVRSAERASRS